MYGGSIEPAVRKKGENQCVGFVGSFLDDAYTLDGSGVLDQAAGLMGEMLLRPYTREEAREVLDIAQAFQKEMLERHGSRVAFPADEFFLLAGCPIPQAAYYEEFDQLEDGVGLWASRARLRLRSRLRARALEAKRSGRWDSDE